MKLLSGFIVVLIGLALWWAFAIGPLRDPQEAYSDFLSGAGREEIRLTDPLVLAGSRVLPLVAGGIADRASPKRRYAIGHLGCAGFKPALPAIRAILLDESERDYFRADALEAIWEMEPAEGLSLASQFQAQTDFLGQSALRLAQGRPLTYCRSWSDAFLGRAH